MPMVNCKVEMRLKWTKHCVLTIAGVDHAEANRNNIILTIKDKKLYVPVVTLPVKQNKKLSKFFNPFFACISLMIQIISNEILSCGCIFHKEN